MPSRAPGDTLTAEAIWFRSGPYRLEGELAYAGGSAAGAAVIAGPHPLLGGSMQNNVVRGLAEGLARRGVVTLRFNYRGVGNSGGPPADVAGHLAEFWATSHVADEPAYRDDFAAAADFLRDALGDGVPAARIGYSFGCSLLPHVAAGADLPLVLVAPTIGTHDYAAFAGLANPVLVIASEDDFAAPAGQARRWFGGLAGRPRLIQGRFDNHFFRGHEGWLAETVFDFVRGERGADA
jgi:alpha/beta superfamily hydrolase